MTGQVLCQRCDRPIREINGSLVPCPCPKPEETPVEHPDFIGLERVTRETFDPQRDRVTRPADGDRLIYAPAHWLHGPNWDSTYAVYQQADPSRYVLVPEGHDALIVEPGYVDVIASDWKLVTACWDRNNVLVTAAREAQARRPKPDPLLVLAEILHNCPLHPEGGLRLDPDALAERLTAAGVDLSPLAGVKGPGE